MNRFFTKLLYGGSARRRNYEESCIGWLLEQLSENARATLNDQLASVWNIQRNAKDKLVIFYFGDDLPKIPLFANQREELLVGRLAMRGVDGTKIKCDVVFHRGRISTLEFSKPPRPLLEGNAVLEKVEMLADPLAVDGNDPPAPTPSRAVKLDELRRRLPIETVKPPVSEAKIVAFLKTIDTVRPADFDEILRETDGFRANDWEFYGTQVRRIVTPDGNYVYLAEAPERALALQAGQSAPHVFEHDVIDDTFTDCGASFIDALIKVAAA